MRVRVGLALLFCGVLLALLLPVPTFAASFTDVTDAFDYPEAVGDLSDLGVIDGFNDGTFRPHNPIIRQQFSKMVVKTIGLPVVGDELSPFTDVPVAQNSSDLFYPDKYVAVCALAGITEGVTPTTFAPFANITRAQILSMVVRAARYRGVPLEEPGPAYYQGTSEGTHMFSSLADPEHGLNVQRAELNGLIDGIQPDGPGYWDVYRNASRGEAIQILWRLWQKMGSPSDPGQDEQVPYLPANFGDSYGFIQLDGKTAITPRFENAEPFSGNRAVVTLGDYYTFVDKTGALVTQLFEGAWSFSEGLAAVRVGADRGYIDQSGNIVISPQYQVAGRFSGGLAPVKTGGKWGYIDKSGLMVIEPQFDLAWEFSEGKALVVVAGNKGFIDPAGTMVISPQYEDAWRFSQGLAAVRSGGKWGFINADGHMVIQPTFDDAWWFSEGLAPVRIGGKWGYVNLQGSLVIPPQYDTAYGFAEGRAVVRIGDLNGYIDKSGSVVVSAKYAFASSFVRGRALVRNNGVESYIDKNGQKIWTGLTAPPTPQVETEGNAPYPPPSSLNQPKPPIGLIVFDGDSLTIGTQATDPYPSQLMRTWSPPARWWNLGVGGQGIAEMKADAVQQVDSKYDAMRGRNVVVVWGGTNDMALWLRSPQQVLAVTRQYSEERRARGFLVLVGTCLPRSGRVSPDIFEGRRQDLNALLRAHWSEFADGLVDVAADPLVGEAGSELDLRFFDADRVHLNNTGLGVIANMVARVLGEL